MGEDSGLERHDVTRVAQHAALGIFCAPHCLTTPRAWASGRRLLGWEKEGVYTHMHFTKVL